MTMKVLLYLSNIDKSWGGVYQYSLALLKLIRGDRENEYFLFMTKQNSEIEEIARFAEQVTLIPISECQEKLTVRITNKLIRATKRIFGGKKHIDRSSIRSVIHKYHIDIFHCPFDYLPPNISVPQIVTIHDLQELKFPQYFSPEQLTQRSKNRQYSILSSNTVLSSYLHVSKDVEYFFPVSKGKTRVCLMKMDELWFSNFSEDQIELASEFEPEFLLYPAATWEHKNHVNLLKAYSLAKDRLPTLICTGAKTDHYFETIEALVKELNLTDRVKFLGIVDDRMLLRLYKSCKAVVVPTMYEAGSFPLMESMLMNVPVICSNVTSLPETIDNAEFTFDPSSIDEMVEKMISISENDEFRKRNLQNSLLKSPRLTNTGALEKLKGIYAEIGVD